MLPKIIRITVLPDDIENGKPKKAEACPIARAGNRAVPSGFTANVMGHDILFYTPDAQHFYYELPKSAQKFIAAFDDSESGVFLHHVRPFSFNVRFIRLETFQK